MLTLLPQRNNCCTLTNVPVYKRLVLSGLFHCRNSLQLVLLDFYSSLIGGIIKTNVRKMCRASIYLLLLITALKKVQAQGRKHIEHHLKMLHKTPNLNTLPRHSLKGQVHITFHSQPHAPLLWCSASRFLHPPEGRSTSQTSSLWKHTTVSFVLQFHVQRAKLTVSQWALQMHYFIIYLAVSFSFINSCLLWCEDIFLEHSIYVEFRHKRCDQCSLHQIQMLKVHLLKQSKEILYMPFNKV